MITSVCASYEPIRYIAFNNIVAGYTGIGTSFDHPARLVRITNNTDADLMFTYNTDEDQIIVPAYTSYVDDISANTYTTQHAGILAKEKGSRLYVKRIEAPTKKGVYVSVLYGSDHE
jgi:hypothetical protein